MGISFWHILVVIVVAVVLFGRGRLSGVMEDLAKGIKAFKNGMKDDDDKSKVIDQKKDGTP